MPQNAVYRRALQRASKICGSDELLAARLGVSTMQLKLWMDGVEPCPGDHFLSVVDLIVDSEVSSIRPGSHAANAPRKPTDG